MSAIPSTVTGSGASYSSIRTPRVLSSATAAWMSGTRHAIWVWVSTVPTVLSGDRQLGPTAAPEDDPIARVLPEDLEPEDLAIEGPTGIEVQREQDGKHRVVAQDAHGYLHAFFIGLTVAVLTTKRLRTPGRSALDSWNCRIVIRSVMARIYRSRVAELVHGLFNATVAPSPVGCDRRLARIVAFGPLSTGTRP